MKRTLTALSITAVLVGGSASEVSHVQEHNRTQSMEAVVYRSRQHHNPLAREWSRYSGVLAVSNDTPPPTPVAPAQATTARTRLGRWRGPCSTWQFGERLTPSLWQSDPARGQRMMTRLVVCVFDRYAPGNSTYAISIARRESGLYPWAQNVSSLCSGLFQHILSAWPARASSYLPHSNWAPGVLWPDSHHEDRLVFDPRANAMAAAKMVAGGGWGPWGG